MKKNCKNLRNCHIKMQMGTEYFTLASTVLDSKQELNQITFKIIDFNSFAQNVNGMQEQNCTVNMFLSKEGDNRYLKLKCAESDSLIMQNRSEIKLQFNQLPYPQVEDKLFGMNIKSKDLNKLLDISSSNQCDLDMSFNIRTSGNNQGVGTIYFKLKSPSIKIVYDVVKVFDTGDASSQKQTQQQQDQESENVQNVLFKISQIHAKQLQHICSLDEQMSISILRDGSLGIEFWEAEGPENESTIIAMKHFVVPKLDNLDFDYNEMEVENDEEYSPSKRIKQEEGQPKKRKNKLCSDSDDEENAEE